MVSTFHQCSYDNSTIFSINKLKTIDASLLFPLLSLFFLIFFQLVSKSRFFISWTITCIQTAYHFQRERERGEGERREDERESPKSSREGVVGWCEGAAEASY